VHTEYLRYGLPIGRGSSPLRPFGDGYALLSALVDGDVARRGLRAPNRETDLDAEDLDVLDTPPSVTEGRRRISNRHPAVIIRTSAMVVAEGAEPTAAATKPATASAVMIPPSERRLRSVTHESYSGRADSRSGQ
jgi:hypothetical protein